VDAAHSLRQRGHFTQKCLDSKGVHPSDLKTLADLAKFPFTTKTDLRDNYPFGLFAVPREQVARLHASSGTTGKSIVVGYTLKDIDNWAKLVARSIRAAGGRAGDMVHNAYGYGMFTGGLGAHYGAERAGLHRGADVGRADREAGAADHGLPAATSSWSRRPTRW
jgi:phenylacetate-CoA ligase